MGVAEAFDTQPKYASHVEYPNNNTWEERTGVLMSCLFQRTRLFKLIADT